MALNWVQTTTQGDKPVPLPQEKIFLSIEKCNLSLEFNSTKQKWTADGTSFVTSQRIIFLRQPPLPTPSDLSIPSQHLRSLSIPIERLLEARYMIPIFGSPYYEARVLPVTDGGLPQPTRQQGTEGNQDAGLGLLKIWFSQGGGIQFREAMEEVKSRLDEQGGKLNHLEQLPSYEPPPSPQGPSRTTSTTSITQAQPPSDSLSNLQINQTTSTSTDPTSIPSSSKTSNVPETTSTTRRRPQRSGTLPPDTEDLEAARVAREIEERENLENLNRDGNQPPPDLVESSGSVVEGNSVNQGGGVAEGAPPGYEEACER